MFAFITPQVAQGIDLVLAAAGLIFFWHLWLNPKARASRPSHLPVWVIRTSEFFLFLCCLCVGAVISQIIIGLIAKAFISDQDAFLVIAGSGFQSGLIGGAFVFFKFIEKKPAIVVEPPPRQNVLKNGFVTFLIALPLILISSLLWQALLRGLNIPVVQQSLTDRFINTKDPVMLIVMIVIATVIAPIAEEVVFRAGLYRFARVRLPNFLALTIPSLCFALLHVNFSSLDGLATLVPLWVLGMVFSIAYERTGNLAVPIIAHSFFNLNTILMLLAGVKS